MELIKYSTFENGEWSTSILAPFSGKFRIEAPRISPDGKKFFFEKRTTVNGREICDIYYMNKTDAGWSEPRNMGSPINSTEFDKCPSPDANGNLYFISMREGRPKIFCSQYLNGKYDDPKALDSIINRYAPSDLFISPDGSFILFRVNSGPYYAQLYVSFNEKGSWTNPQNLGPKINFDDAQERPCISPDGNYLFYTSASSRDWILSQYQVELKPLLDSLRTTCEINAIVGQENNLDVPAAICPIEQSGKIKISKTPSWLKPSIVTSGKEKKISNKINLNGLKAGTYRAQVNLTTGNDPVKKFSYSVVLNLFEPVHAVTMNNLKNGIEYKYYEDTSITTIPDFSKMKPKKTGIANNFDLSVKNRDTLFAVIYNGYINIPQTALYSFFLTSDDGSKLYIDDKLYIDNDGMHAPSTKLEKCCLEKGFHKIKLEYMQSMQGHILELSYGVTEEGIERKKFSDTELFISEN